MCFRGWFHYETNHHEINRNTYSILKWGQGFHKHSCVSVTTAIDVQNIEVKIGLGWGAVHLKKNLFRLRRTVNWLDENRWEDALKLVTNQKERAQDVLAAGGAKTKWWSRISEDKQNVSHPLRMRISCVLHSTYSQHTVSIQSALQSALKTLRKITVSVRTNKRFSLRESIASF